MKKQLLLLFILSLTINSYAQDDPITASSLDLGFTAFNQGTAFTTISIDSTNNKIWAGTNKFGLFSLDITQTELPTDFPIFTGRTGNDRDFGEFNITTISGDGLGRVWIGHQGINFGGSLGGVEELTDGVARHYSGDRNFRGFPFFERDGLATLRINSITVDKNNRVWVAQRYHDLLSSPDYFVTPGDLSYKDFDSEKFTTRSPWWDPSTGTVAAEKPELPYPAFTYNPPASEAAQTRNMSGISSDSTKVWVGVWGYKPDNDPDNYIPPRVLAYDLSGTLVSQGSSLGGYNFSDMNIPPGGIINGVCANNSKGTWITTGISGKGFSVFYNGSWTYMDTTNAGTIIPPNTRFNNNAIWKNNYGNVFMGTTNGLLVYDGRGPANEVTSYTFCSKTEVFPSGSSYNVIDPDMTSNNITGGVSESNRIQWITSDNGIMRSQIGHVSNSGIVGYTRTLTFNSTNNPESSSNPRSLNNTHINAVEDAFDTRVCNNDDTCHTYEVKTVIASPNSPSGRYATVENVYRLMREQAQFQAITPNDIPSPVLGDDFLDEIIPNQPDIERFNELVNLESEKITNLYDVMEKDPGVFDKYGDITNQNFPTWAGDIFTNAPPTNSVAYYANLQKQDNNEKSVNGATYNLYNTQAGVNTRDLFFKNYSNAILPEIQGPNNCEVPGEPNGIRNIYYDPIVLFIDDTNYKMVNYTEAGHIFYPGTITRTVKRDNDTGEIYVLTEGDGFHFCTGLVGVQIGKTNHLVGSVVFKNVDLRLKKAFDELYQD